MTLRAVCINLFGWMLFGERMVRSNGLASDCKADETIDESLVFVKGDIYISGRNKVAESIFMLSKRYRKV